MDSKAADSEKVLQHPLDDDSLRRPRCHPDLLSWQRAETPFCASDLALKAFRHQQNPRKPLPHPGLTFRDGLKPNNCGSIDQGIIDWVKSASVNDKQLAFNLMRCLAVASAEGDATADSRLPDILAAPRQGRPQTARRSEQAPDRTDTQALFGTARRAKRVEQQTLDVDYVYPGAGFLNARPAIKSSFTVHPEWVSERMARIRSRVPQQQHPKQQQAKQKADVSSK